MKNFKEYINESRKTDPVIKKIIDFSKTVPTMTRFISRETLKSLYINASKGIYSEDEIDKLGWEIILELKPFIEKSEILHDMEKEVKDQKKYDKIIFNSYWYKINSKIVLLQEIYDLVREHYYSLYKSIKNKETPFKKLEAIDMVIQIAHDHKDFGDTWVEDGREFLDELQNGKYLGV